ncbi:MAG: DNA polymerase III subunit chi [Rhodobacteraceae bacterium PARR1]|nr:MAG: DNA polymerase III subunit chi [Rhodobacteraceae bacterium PARR1]
MGVAMFYHLTRSSPAETLAALLPRAVSQGWRVMIRSPDRAALARLDTALWTDPPDSFLPHGMEGGPHDADQPVLLGQGAAVNGAKGLFLLDGAEVSVAEVQPMERVWLLFDGGDGAAVQAARVKWKTLTAAGIAAQYWSEESGRWQKKADSVEKG